MATDPGLAAAVDLSSLSAAVPAMEAGRVDHDWLLSWYCNAEETMAAWAAAGRVTAAQVEDFRAGIHRALSGVPGLQLVHCDDPPDEGDPLLPPDPGWRDLAEVDPVLHGRVRCIIDREVAESGGAGRPDIELGLTEQDGHDFLVFGGREWRTSIRLPAAGLSGTVLRHAVARAVEAADEHRDPP